MSPSLTSFAASDAIIFFALLSSSILCTTEMEPKLLGIPALGALGYAAAVGLTVWVFVKISKNE